MFIMRKRDETSVLASICQSTVAPTFIPLALKGTAELSGHGLSFIQPKQFAYIYHFVVSTQWSISSLTNPAHRY